MEVTVLFTRKNSIYKKMGLDCYDIERDARLYTGSNPVVCHPPCRAWGQLSHFAKPRADEMDLAHFAIAQVRRCGGVLEHPAASRLWPSFLPMPGSYDEYGGYTICVNQSDWGHRARKKTLLYIIGCKKNDLPPLRISFDLVKYVIATSKRKKNGLRGSFKKEVNKSEKEATPEAFARFLVEIASRTNLTL